MIYDFEYIDRVYTEEFFLDSLNNIRIGNTISYKDGIITSGRYKLSEDFSDSADFYNNIGKNITYFNYINQEFKERMRSGLEIFFDKFKYTGLKHYYLHKNNFVCFLFRENLIQFSLYDKYVTVTQNKSLLSRYNMKSVRSEESISRGGITQSRRISYLLQPSRVYLYLIYNKQFCKVGITMNLFKRINQLSIDTKSIFCLYYFVELEKDVAYRIEELFYNLPQYNINISGKTECFDIKYKDYIFNTIINNLND